MKYFIFSIDDGTIYDKKVIEIFSKYNIRATFNLNSGLTNYVWYLNDLAIKRLNLEENKSIYHNHEIASHSLTHPHLTQCSGEHIVYEVGQDITNLERIFSRKVSTFAFPFEDFDDRCIDTIKYIKNIQIIRLSETDDSFAFPSDLYHVKITSLGIDDALNKLDKFINSKNAKLFTFVFHSYDFEVNNNYNKLELLCQKISKEKSIEIITMSELSKIKI